MVKGILGGAFLDNIFEKLYSICLFLDGIAYWAVSTLYDVYVVLAKAQIFNSSAYQDIVNNILSIIGVVMLFYLAYALLKALVNPDDLKTTSKIATNLVISLILISVVPTIFNYAFKVQEMVMDENIVGKIVLGPDSIYDPANIGKTTSMNFLEAFLQIPDKDENDESININEYENWTSLKSCIVNNKQAACNGNETFLNITSTAEVITTEESASYIPIVSTICGVFMAYIILSFCLDLGIRVFKLAFYQILSPVPILMRIIPEKKSVFDNWVKATLATFMEVFIRLFIMYIVTFFCARIFDKDNSILSLSDVGIIPTIIIVLGLFAFAKQAPKLISNVIGIDASNFKLGIRDKLVAGGGFIMAAAVGGGITSAVKGFTHGVSNVKKANGFGNKAREIGRIFSNTGGGLIGGAARSGYQARNAKSYKDLISSTTSGINNTVLARDRRESYRASHGNSTVEVIGGRLNDVGAKIANWAGVIPPLEQLKKSQGIVSEVASARKSIDDRLNSLVNTQKNIRTLSSATNVAGIGAFNNYATLLNAIDMAKSTGQIRTSAGNVVAVTADMLTELNRAEFKMKNQMKKEILSGYQTDGTLTRDLPDNFDRELRELITSYRTKAYSNINNISQLINMNDPKIKAAYDKLYQQAVTNKDKDLTQFILDGNATDMYLKNNNRDGTIGATSAIEDAQSNINVEVAKAIEKENKEKKS